MRFPNMLTLDRDPGAVMEVWVSDPKTFSIAISDGRSTNVVMLSKKDARELRAWLKEALND